MVLDRDKLNVVLDRDLSDGDGSEEEAGLNGVLSTSSSLINHANEWTSEAANLVSCRSIRFARASLQAEDRLENHFSMTETNFIFTVIVFIKLLLLDVFVDASFVNKHGSLNLQPPFAHTSSSDNVFTVQVKSNVKVNRKINTNSVKKSKPCRENKPKD